MTVKTDELKRMAEYHQNAADEYAERSHEVDPRLADDYSSVSEAHGSLAATMREIAGIPQPD